MSGELRPGEWVGVDKKCSPRRLGEIIFISSEKTIRDYRSKEDNRK